MCDTVAFPASNGNDAIFGKNSDREPGEPQLIQYATPDTVTAGEVRLANEKPAYISDALPVLEEALANLRSGGRQSFGALISRPSWMWGAEMGVNDAGVAIGNEAVFSRNRAPGKPLLGMDILRLALHFSSTAAEGASLIRELVERYGQGGDGGWKHRSEYSNSYLVQDSGQAWLVETSGLRVRCRPAPEATGISNTYDRDGGWDTWPALKRKDERALIALGARSRKRNELKAPWLRGDRPMATASDMFALLRTHGSADGRVCRGMGSLCIHTGRLIKSESTSSMVVHWHTDGPVAWVTGSSWPCLSLYKPLVVGPGNPAETGAHAEHIARMLRDRRERIGRWADKSPGRFAEFAQGVRDGTEAEFLRLVYDRGSTGLREIVAKCHAAESEYMAQFEALIG
jgi:secernin